ncbi:hypothetical protein [Lentilactobacillus kefiri]|uniref:hypothetical protein n=1 Tax=Lentilactobacillus kefiri TaxID=33962 RepID=UPI002468CCBE|nr:hypothetical protein [Lentilactobacillus kefiri]MDH5107750.1 hypothetical protein [Lentilactobacillus kefiri]
MAIYHNGIKIKNLYHNGKKINKIFHNGKCIYASIVAVGESLYDGIPSNGIMLYGDVAGYSSSNPLGIQGYSINLKAPLSSCPNGITIHFSNISYSGNGSPNDGRHDIPDINISKESPSALIFVPSINIIITANINRAVLAFYVRSGAQHRINAGTVAFADSERQYILAITSIKAY